MTLLLSGCGFKTGETVTAKPPSPALFEEVAAQVGVSFTHTNGATGKFHYIEFSPAGCAFFDYDNDGWLDIFLVQSGSSEPPDSAKPEETPRPFCALYRNNGDGTFANVTAGSGLDKDVGYGQGVTVGDYDNDGYDDLFLTAYGGNRLFHNERGTGKFADVTAEQGLAKIHSTGYATSAAFGDYDNDGRLDLYVCYYSPWEWKSEKPCYDAQKNQDYCPPSLYDPDTHRLYHNEGGRFVDVSEKAGITKAQGRGLAVAFVDYDEDGKQDIFVVNDVNQNMLWHNNGDKTFTNQALSAGCALGEGGTAMAGMGIAIADYDRSGHESLFVTNFSDQPNTLFKNVGGTFQDVSLPAGVALPHLKFLSFGCEFLDYDADGWSDLLIANGHVYVHAATRLDGITYKERKQLLHNDGKGTFREITAPAELGDMGIPTVSRGMAVGDYDNDGRLDALFSNQNDPAQLFRNRVQNGNHWVSFLTVGTKSNRDGLHTRFTLTASGERQIATVRAGSSYLSTSARRVYFGLGKADKIEKVEVRWPSGKTETLTDVPVNTIHVITEGKGLTGTLPAGKTEPSHIATARP